MIPSLGTAEALHIFTAKKDAGSLQVPAQDSDQRA